MLFCWIYNIIIKQIDFFSITYYNYNQKEVIQKL